MIRPESYDESRHDESLLIIQRYHIPAKEWKEDTCLHTNFRWYDGLVSALEDAINGTYGCTCNEGPLKDIPPEELEGLRIIDAASRVLIMVAGPESEIIGNIKRR